MYDQVVTALMGSKAAAICGKAAEYVNAGYLGKLITSDEDRSRAKHLIEIAITWVVAMDYYHETGDVDYDILANEKKNLLYGLLDGDQVAKLRIIEAEIVDPYWVYEASLKRRLLEGGTFTVDESLASVWRRSADTVLYWKLANFVQPLPEDIFLVTHTIQALEDIEDCIDDYQEDKRGFEPNIFLMLLSVCSPQRCPWPETFDQARYQLKRCNVFSSLLAFIAEMFQKAHQIPGKDMVLPLINQLHEAHRSLMIALNSG